MEEPRKLSLQEKIARLRADYLTRLPGELQCLRELAERLHGKNRDRPVLLELHQRLHKITGTAGSFGCPELTHASRQLEQQIKRWLEDGEGTGYEASASATLKQGIFALSQTVPELQFTLPVAAVESFAPSPVPRRKSQVWLVSADHQQTEALVAQLEPFNYACRCFDDISQLAAELGNTRPDLLILDQALLADHLEAVESLVDNHGLLLIMLAGDDDFASRVQAARLGVSGYFVRPLDTLGLINRIAQLLERATAPAERVLIVDDDADLATHLRLTLMAAGMVADILSQPEDILAALSRFRPELVLMDLHMPQYSGPELAGVIRQYDQYANLPIVYLSAETDPVRQSRAMRAGADDFLLKPVADVQLVVSVRARVVRSRQLNDRIQRDSLTGLLRHAAAKSAYQEHIARAKDAGTAITVVMLDIDHFKRINDTYGHSLGDRVIAAAGVLLRQRLRQTDIIGRYGGEEFLIVLPDCPLDNAVQVIEALRLHFAALRFSWEGGQFSCTLSAGLACTTDFPTLDASGLLDKADQALYRAKSAGRNRIDVARPEPAGSPGS